MSDQELLYKLLDKVDTINSRTAVMETKQDAHISLHKDLVDDVKLLKKDHYILKDDFKSHKNKFLLITGSIGSIFGFITAFCKDFILHTFKN